MKLQIFNIHQYHNLTNIQKHIMRMINEEHVIIVANSISHVAKLWHISLPSLSRFSKKIGFNSFNNLRVFIAERAIFLGSIKGKEDESIIEKNIKAMIAANNESIKKTFANKQNIINISEEANKIKLCKHLLIFGYDLNSHPAKMMSEKFAELGVNTRYSSVKDLFTSYISVFNGPETIAIIFSNSLQNRKYEIFEEQCKINNIKLFFITSSNRFPEYKRIKLLPSESEAFKEYLVSNLQVMAINALYNALILSFTKFKENELKNIKLKL